MIEITLLPPNHAFIAHQIPTPTAQVVILISEVLGVAVRLVTPLGGSHGKGLVRLRMVRVRIRSTVYKCRVTSQSSTTLDCV